MKFQRSSLRLPVLNSSFLLKLVCACWLVTKLICYKLWLAGRFFPLVPVHDALQQVPPIMHSLLFAVSLGCMLLVWIFPNRKVAVILLLSELLSCMLDQNRWQPWEYQFICMLGAFVFITDEKKRVQAWQIIMVGIYFFSGLSKCSSYFIHNVWDYLFLRELAGIHNAGRWLLRAGYALPLLEMLAAAALCFKPTRKAAVWFLCAMHLLNLLVFGPAGININAVIWPWNVLMPFLLIGLFYNSSLHLFERPALKPVYTMLMLLAWWMLPWLQLAGLWDRYLSGVLYSGRNEQLFICTNDLGASYRLANCITIAGKGMDCNTAISTYKWGMQEMNTAPYPETRVFKAIAASWNKTYPKAINHFYLFRGGFVSETKPLFPDK